jgi:hypothetical protein
MLFLSVCTVCCVAPSGVFQQVHNTSHQFQLNCPIDLQTQFDLQTRSIFSPNNMLSRSVLAVVLVLSLLSTTAHAQEDVLPAQELTASAAAVEPAAEVAPTAATEPTQSIAAPPVDVPVTAESTDIAPSLPTAESIDMAPTSGIAGSDVVTAPSIVPGPLHLDPSRMGRSASGFYR